MMILAQQGFVGVMTAKADLTYLADTVLMLRYCEMEGAVRQAEQYVTERSTRQLRIAAWVVPGPSETAAAVCGHPQVDGQYVLQIRAAVGPAVR